MIKFSYSNPISKIKKVWTLTEPEAEIRRTGNHQCNSSAAWLSQPNPKRSYSKQSLPRGSFITTSPAHNQHLSPGTLLVVWSLKLLLPPVLYHFTLADHFNHAQLLFLCSSSLPHVANATNSILACIPTTSSTITITSYLTFLSFAPSNSTPCQIMIMKEIPPEKLIQQMLQLPLGNTRRLTK